MIDRLVMSIMASAFCYAMASVAIANLRSDSPYTLTEMWYGHLVMTAAAWLVLIRLIWRKVE